MAMDKKKLERLAKLVHTVTGLCKEPNMNLKNSPPFILYVLPQIYQHLRAINARYEANPHVLNEMDYMHIFIENLTARCQQCASLFDVEPEAMLDKNSEGRRTLTKLTLAFSHMMYELKAFFPDNTYTGSSFTVTKVDAANWWKRHFNRNVIVTWQKFISALRETHAIGSSQLQSLKDTIDLTCNGHISVFEFDVFTKLFQPWSNLLQCWNALAISHPGYMAFCTYEEVTTRLEAFINKPGSYVFRLSCSRLGQWAIGYVDYNKSILQMIPQNKPLFQVLIDGQKDGTYLYPDGNNCNPDLSPLLNNNMGYWIQETEEQYDAYSSMDTTFRVCKICSDNDKNTRLEPCGHLLCAGCLHAWQKSGGKDCPFCRKEIGSTEPVSIEAYRRTESLRNSLPRDLHILTTMQDNTADVNTPTNWSIYATPTNTRRNSIHLQKPPPVSARSASSSSSSLTSANAVSQQLSPSPLPSPSSSTAPPIPPRRLSPSSTPSGTSPPSHAPMLPPRRQSPAGTPICISPPTHALLTRVANRGAMTAVRQMSHSDEHLARIQPNSLGESQGRACSQGHSRGHLNVDSTSLATLVREGFDYDKAMRALEISIDNLVMAREILLSFT